MMTDEEFLESVNIVRRARGWEPLTLAEAIDLRSNLPGRKPYEKPTVRDATPEEVEKILG
jgi:hypothetical protein